MIHAGDHIHVVTSFNDLVSTSFRGKINAVCWERKLAGDFSEIVAKAVPDENIAELAEDELLNLQLSDAGQLARAVLLDDLRLLKAHGAAPVLNLIRFYERDPHPFFPADVYSFHADRSPIPTDTFLCTYYGEPSEILPNSQAEQKVHIPEIRHTLKKTYRGAEEDFDSFLTENFFDLHYRPKPGAQPVSLEIGHLWRLATDHPGSRVPPCIHRAPIEKNGQIRLMLIC